MKSQFLILLFVTISVTHGFSQKSKLYLEASCAVDSTNFINEEVASNIYTYFKSSELFDWKNDPNNCEDRANAVSILLKSWQIPNYKVWVFSGSFLKKDNGLLIVAHKIRWKYHVATVIPVKKNGVIAWITIDPATTQTPYNISDWASNVTDSPFSYYFLTDSEQYIWSGKGKNIGKSTFIEKNDTNYDYTIQGLAGFNGLNAEDRRAMRSAEGIEKLQATKTKFELLQHNKPAF